MKRGYITISLLLVFISVMSKCLEAAPRQSTLWKAHWITAAGSQSATNTWICFRKEITVQKKSSVALAKIAVDSKYWLWINGQLVIFEGGLKRGPNPYDTYYDEVNIAPYLQKGENTIALLLWYFGKDGFSHNSSGKAGLVFQCIPPGMILLSDQTWKARIDPAYELSTPPRPNYRLAESNVYYDVRKDLGTWHTKDYNAPARGFRDAMELGIPP